MNQRDVQEEYNPYAPPMAGTESGSVFGDERAAEEEQILAGPWTRFGARWVDQLLVGVALIPAALVWGASSAASNDGSNGQGVSLAIALGLIPLALLIYQWVRIAKTGQSIAKKWMKIRIVRMNGAPVDFVSGVLLREWLIFALTAIPGIGSVFSLVDGVMIFGADRRCLHDKMAGTKVILVLPSI